MTSDTIIKVQELIQTLNYKQQTIAQSLIIDSKYLIFEATIGGGKSSLYIKDEQSVYLLIDFIKSKCNCD